MTRPPATFTTANLTANRLRTRDLAFMQTLMTRPEMNAHKPNPTAPSPEQIAQSHAADLAHWADHGFGRYLVLKDNTPIGLCGLTRRDDMPGLNVSYHLSPKEWGQGHASALIVALTNLARENLPGEGPIYGLVRPANPASARVLVKAGFIQSETLSLSGAPTTRYERALTA